MLAERWEQAEATSLQRAQQGWTSYQIADRLLLDHLRDRSADLQPYAEPERRADALAQFHEYAYRWY